MIDNCLWTSGSKVPFSNHNQLIGLNTNVTSIEQGADSVFRPARAPFTRESTPLQERHDGHV